MGTYTTHYNLFMPSIGEQGWGELVNNNFSTIDTTMSGLNTRVGTLETDTDTMKEKLDAFSVDTDGNIVGTFKGNVIGDVTGNLNGKLSVSSVTTTAGDLRIVEATFPTESGAYIRPNLGSTITLNCKNGTVAWYNTSIIDFTGNADDLSSTCTITITPNTVYRTSYTVRVVNNTTNVIVLNRSATVGTTEMATTTYTFNRNPIDSYTLTVTFSDKQFFSVSTSTPKKTFYVA